MKTFFRVKCRRNAFLLNRLLSVGVSVEAVQSTEFGLCFSVPRRQAGRVTALLEEQGIAYERTGFQGVKGLFKAALARPFLLAALLLSVVGVIFFEQFVYGYTIKGNQLVNTSSVRAVLQDNHLDGFTYKGSIDLKKIKREIGALDGVSFASVRLVGTRLQVEIKESLPARTPEEVSYSPITSAYSAVVTKVIAQSGTPRVKAGDSVRSGDLLIQPVYAFTEGESPAPAAGEVWGIVTYQREVALASVTVESVLTGEYKKVRQVTLFGKEVGKTPSSLYQTYDREERLLYRGFGLQVKEIVYRKRQAQTLYHDFDEEAPALTQKSVQTLLAEVPFCARERGAVTVTQKKVDNILFIVLYYTVEQRIDSLPNAP